jgi:hypothetical protein
MDRSPIEKVPVQRQPGKSHQINQRRQMGYRHNALTGFPGDQNPGQARKAGDDVAANTLQKVAANIDVDLFLEESLVPTAILADAIMERSVDAGDFGAIAGHDSSVREQSLVIFRQNSAALKVYPRGPVPSPS